MRVSPVQSNQNLACDFEPRDSYKKDSYKKETVYF